MIKAQSKMLLVSIILFIIISLCIYSSCIKKPQSEQIAIQINDYSLTIGEFNELFAESNVSRDTPDVRKKFLDNLIVRKLILNEAEWEGLDKQKEFLKSIEGFWEQSLLKVMIDKKTLEIYSDIQVTDKEIEDAFQKWVEQNPDDTKTLNEMRDFIYEQLLRVKQSLAFNLWIQGLKSKARIIIDKKAIGIE